MINLINAKNLVGKDTHPTILIKTIQKKQDLSEHILEAKFMLLKANLMTGQDRIRFVNERVGYGK